MGQEEEDAEVEEDIVKYELSKPPTLAHRMLPYLWVKNRYRAKSSTWGDKSMDRTWSLISFKVSCFHISSCSPLASGLRPKWKYPPALTMNGLDGKRRMGQIVEINYFEVDELFLKIFEDENLAVLCWVLPPPLAVVWCCYGSAWTSPGGQSWGWFCLRVWVSD